MLDAATSGSRDPVRLRLMVSVFWKLGALVTAEATRGLAPTLRKVVAGGERTREAVAELTDTETVALTPYHLDVDLHDRDPDRQGGGPGRS